MATTARKAAIATLVALSIVLAALALWKIKALIALLLLAFVIAAAMRPGVDWLAAHHIRRSLGVALHFLAFLGLLALFLWLVVPSAIHQVDHALGSVPTTRAQLRHQAAHSTGIKHEILVGIQKRLKKLPSVTNFVTPAVSIGKTAFEVVIGIFFTFACAAYWIFERDRAVDLVVSLLPRRRRKVVRDTWWLIDMKLGAFVRGELLLIALVGALLSFAFWLDGLPYWLLLGSFAGVVEIVPVIGPLAAGVLAIGAGFTQGWVTALGAGLAVLILRQIEDNFVAPHVLGSAVGLSPLVVLVSVTVVGFLLGAFYVLLAIPIAAVAATVVDVVLRNKDPAQEETPTVLFAARETKH